MLKFFRRIRRKLIDEGNLKRYLIYAIGEILLVMIGILLALQVNNWNESKKAGKEESQILQNLHQEFVDSKTQFNRIQEMHQRIFSAMEYLLDVLETERVNENLMDSIYTKLTISSFGTPTSNPSLGIVNSLISSGKQNLIRDDSLKLYLIKWNDLVGDYQEEERTTQEYKFTYLYPLIASMSKLPSKRLTGGLFEWNKIKHGKVDLTQFESKEFYNYLSQCWVLSRIILVKDSYLSEGREVQETLDNILSLIEKELEFRN